MKTSDTIKQLFEDNYRTIVGQGNSTFRIVQVSHPRSCAAETITTQHRYKDGWKALKNWYYTDALHVLKYADSELPRECDGILNLYSKFKRNILVDRNAEFYSDRADREVKLYLYKAIWVHQKAGTLIEERSGFIAALESPKKDFLYFHGDTENEVIRGVWRKYKSDEFIRKSNQEFQERILKNEKQFQARIKDLEISFADSIKAGNCRAGTEAFINRFNLDKKKKYPAAIVLRLAKRAKKVTEVKRIIHYKLSVNESPAINEPAKKSIIHRVKEFFWKAA